MTTAIHCRPILPREAELIEEATTINNDVWGKGLTSSPEDFRSRANLGYLIGAFGPEGLQGTISTLELPSSALAEDVAGEGLLSTWEGATGNGRFTTAEPGSDTLCCVAVTAVTARRPGARPPRPVEGLDDSEYADWARLLLEQPSVFPLPEPLADLARRLFPAYLDSNLDPVLRFHSRDKGPLGGTTPWLPVPGGRPSDAGSLGYNVLLRYPELTPRARQALLAPSDYAPSAVGEALVLGAARLAASLPSIKYVVPYSRPAAFRRNLGRLCARMAGAKIPFSRPEEQNFDALAREA